ncbi:MAG: tol-pal system protein YbgF [Myxococcota bacterium]
MSSSRGLAAALLFASGPWLSGCVSLAEFRKLQYEVRQMRAGTGSSGRIADVSAEMDAMREQLSQLEGRLEVNEHQTQEALEEAKAARMSAAQGGVGAPSGASHDDPTAGLPPGRSASEEVKSYRAAYDAWRSNDNQVCIDRFGQFLQSFPTSQYADDAAFWLADCYYKQGDLKTAILRFDDVATRYPKSEKASEALYRQGEALLKLGPNFGKAAEKAFERVVKEYPQSQRAHDAEQQLKLLGAG